MNNENNSMSIASFICGIVSFFIFPFIFGLTSIILGIIAFSRQESKNGYAVIGIVLGIAAILWVFYSINNI